MSGVVRSLGTKLEKLMSGILQQGERRMQLVLLTAEQLRKKREETQIGLCLRKISAQT